MLGWHGCIWVVVVLGCPETSPLGPRTTVLSASLGQSDLSCMFVIEVCVQPWAARCGRECVSNQAFPWDVEGIHCSSLRVWNWRDIERKFLVQAGCEQVDLGTLPKFGNLFEDLWRKRPLR